MSTKPKTTKPKAVQGDEKPATEALMTSAELYAASGYNHPAISGFAAIGVIKQRKRGMWPAVATLGALLRKARERAEDNGAKDRARKNKAEADTAEQNALESSGKTCLLVDAKEYVSDHRIAARQAVERATFLTPIQKTKLIAEFAKIKIKPPEKPE